MTELPTVRWGIISTGKIAQWLVSDLLKPDWPEKSANHVIQAIGASTLDKCKSFVDEYVSTANPTVKPGLYGSYEEVYNDPDVDCVYIGTPHRFHKQNCLDAIKAGKNVLCEKPFAMNTKEAEEVFAAAHEKGVFIMEAMWTRFFPIMRNLRSWLHDEKKLGDIHRIFCDFGLDIDIPSLPDWKYYKNPELGGGSLLDVGIYSLTWGLSMSSNQTGEEAEYPDVSSTQTIAYGVDTASTVILRFTNGTQAICTSTTTHPQVHPWGRIEGSLGRITIDGETPSSPEQFTFFPKDGSKEEVYAFDKPGFGFWWEADAVAHDLKAGQKQNATMPWAETLRVMRIMDGVRKRGGARFPVDDW